MIKYFEFIAEHECLELLLIIILTCCLSSAFQVHFFGTVADMSGAGEGLGTGAGMYG